VAVVDRRVVVAVGLQMEEVDYTPRKEMDQNKRRA